MATSTIVTNLDLTFKMATSTIETPTTSIAYYRGVCQNSVEHRKKSNVCFALLFMIISAQVASL